MSDRPPFTLEQVTRQLNLSEAVVRRLSASLEMPALYYPQENGRPRLMLYSELEVDVLRRAQSLLLEGRTLSEVQKVLVDLLILSRHQPGFDTASGAGLMAYEDERMKAQLAETSLAQYRVSNSPKEPVLKSLVSRVGKSAPVTLRQTGPFTQKPTWPGWTAPSSSWMSPVFALNHPDGTKPD